MEVAGFEGSVHTRKSSDFDVGLLPSPGLSSIAGFASPGEQSRIMRKGVINHLLQGERSGGDRSLSMEVLPSHPKGRQIPKVIQKREQGLNFQTPLPA